MSASSAFSISSKISRTAHTRCWCASISTRLDQFIFQNLLQIAVLRHSNTVNDSWRMVRLRAANNLKNRIILRIRRASAGGLIGVAARQNRVCCRTHGHKPKSPKPPVKLFRRVYSRITDEMRVSLVVLCGGGSKAACNGWMVLGGIWDQAAVTFVVRIGSTAVGVGFGKAAVCAG